MKSLQKGKRIAAVVITLLLCFSLLACNSEQSQDTLIIGIGQMNGVFSPFFAETADDEVIVKLTSMTLLRLDKEGRPQSYAAKFEEPTETVDEDGAVQFTNYRFELQEGLTFSDGKQVTADDIIFSIKVLCDPAYNGLSTIGSLPIVGLMEYKYDTQNYKEAIQEMQTEAEAVSDSYVEQYIMSMAIADCYTYTMEEIAAYIGYELDSTLSDEDQMDILVQRYYEYEMANFYDYYLGAPKQLTLMSLKVTT